jgi:LacI family transcriptional regulator
VAQSTKIRATMHDVAREANVSIASVSRFINGQTVREEIEPRIKSAILTLNYKPNSAGRALRASKTEQICLSVPDISNPVYQLITKGVQNVLQDTHYRLMLAPRNMSVEENLALLDSLDSNYADGFIFLSLVDDPRIRKAFLKLSIPTVVIGNVQVHEEVDTIKVTSGAVEMALTYLKQKYGGEVLFLNGPSSTIPGKNRELGFLKAMKKNGVDGSKHILEASAFSVEAGLAALEKVKSIGKYRSIICANDLLAAAALRFLSLLKIDVPGEIAVIGIDNTDLAKFLSPSLTSIDYKSEYRGELAAKFMLERLKNPNTSYKKIEISPELVERESA